MVCDYDALRKFEKLHGLYKSSIFPLFNRNGQSCSLIMIKVIHSERRVAMVLLPSFFPMISSMRCCTVLSSQLFDEADKVLEDNSGFFTFCLKQTFAFHFKINFSG